MWNFGSWKTFATFCECYDHLKSDTLVIANVPYKRVDYFYSSVDDLLNVFRVLDEYTRKTNLDIRSYTDSIKNTKDILLIVDEAHLYLWARESLTNKSILSQLKLIFTQCRKRRIRIVFITQRLTQIDIYIRRLADYVEEYRKWSFLWLYRVKKNVYENRWDVADIETDQTVKYTNDWEEKTYKKDSKIYSEFFSPLTIWLQLFSFLDRSYRDIIKEYYQTNYVCWQEDPTVIPLTVESLEKMLLKSPSVPFNLSNWSRRNVPTYYKIYKKISLLFDKGFKKVDLLFHTEKYSEGEEIVFDSLPENKEDLQNISLKRLVVEDIHTVHNNEDISSIDDWLSLKEKLRKKYLNDH